MDIKNLQKDPLIMPSTLDALQPLDFGPPTKELLDWAKDNINEDPDTKCQIISDFRDMIYERGECIPHRTDDAFLLRFLRARHFVIPRAHRLLVNYYNFKEDNPDFINVDLHLLRKLGDDKVITVPPYKEGTGRRILWYRMGKWDPERHTINEMFQATLAILETAILEESAQILGGICIWDLGGIAMQHVWHLTPSVAHKIVQLMVTAFPMKIHAVHVINQSYVFDVIYNIFKPFLNDTMKKRIFFHGENMESLHKHIEPKYLPEVYGGIHPEYDYNEWLELCRKDVKLLLEMESLGYRDSELEARIGYKRE